MNHTDAVVPDARDSSYTGLPPIPYHHSSLTNGLPAVFGGKAFEGTTLLQLDRYPVRITNSAGLYRAWYEPRERFTKADGEVLFRATLKSDRGKPDSLTPGCYTLGASLS